VTDISSPPEPSPDALGTIHTRDHCHSPSRDTHQADNQTFPMWRQLVSEVCSKEHETRGMGIVMGSWGVGLTVGAALGGLLAGG
jgi:hypothetical protein